MELFGPIVPWIGILDAFGVVVVLVGWHLLRGAGDLARSVAAAVGATVLVMALGSAVSGVGTYVSQVALFGFEQEGGRRVTGLVLLLSGIAAGVSAVMWAHGRTAEAAEDLADEAVIAAELAVEPDVEPDLDAEPDSYTQSRLELVAAAPWVDVAALALAIALPVVGGFGFFGGYPGDRADEITVWVAIQHVLGGILLALPLLIVVARDELSDLRVVTGLFALVALHAVVVPIWPQVFANEFWAAFGAGLTAGLMAGVVLSLLSRGIPIDRFTAATGVLIALGLFMVSTVVTTKVGSDQSGTVYDSPSELLPDEFPSEFPLGDLPTDFPFTPIPVP